MASGNPDLLNHLPVMEMLTKSVAPLLSSPNAPDQILTVAALNLNHLGSHLENAQAMGMSNQPAFKELEKFYEGFKKQLGQVVQIREESKIAQQAAMAAVRSEQVAAQPAAEPVPVAPTPNIPGDFTAAPEQAAGVPTLGPGQ